MFCAANSRRFVRYLLLSLLYLEFAFSETIETGRRLGNDEDGGIYGVLGKTVDDDEDWGKVQRSGNGEDEDIYGVLGKTVDYDEYWGKVIKDPLDFLRFTTRKPYIWEKRDIWTTPKRDASDYRNIPFKKVVLYVFLPLSAVGVVGSLLFYCIKHLSGKDCYYSVLDWHSSLSADRATARHRPPERRSGILGLVHGPPTGRNPIDSGRGLLGDVDNNGVASSNDDRTEPCNTITEKPPDYTTVVFSDIISPTMPAFPAVNTINETPPPKYGKANPIFQ